MPLKIGLYALYAFLSDESLFMCCYFVYYYGNIIIMAVDLQWSN